MKSKDRLFSVACLLAALLLPWTASAAVPDANILLVEKGTHRLFRESGSVKRVAVGDPTVADVNVINRRELLITGKALGITSLIVWPSSGSTTHEYRIKVGPIQDPSTVQKVDKDLVQAQIETGRSVDGVLPNLLAHRRAKLDAINGGKDPVTDRSEVALDTQVMTEVKIAEVSRTTAQQFGLNAFKNTASTAAGMAAPGALSSVVSASSGIGYQFNQSLPILNAFNIVVGNPNKGLLGVLSVLESKGMARTLAEPTLLAQSGQTASYLAGGEFPVPVPQSGVSAGGITIDYKEFGVKLKLTPTVLNRDRIALKVAPEVSDLDFSAGIQVGGIAVPALTIRRTDTSIELGDGESFVISGLISSNLLNNVDKVPWLGSLPVLGAFFRETKINKKELELIMVVTPHLVRPMGREARLPKLPGAKYDNYDPSFAETMLLETGDFETGFSK
ncbi:MAG TPA: type II and III secretion system protein family protein [Nevskiaceae bacterium]|nr:type II and III secretion system protein family protein [Nevskiaceae bacterium]